MSTQHKSIDPDKMDFTATSLTSGFHRIHGLDTSSIKLSDKIEWYYSNGYPAASLLVSTVIKWIEANVLHVPEYMFSYECNSIEWLDDNFESATTAYFMEVYAKESEVNNDN